MKTQENCGNVTAKRSNEDHIVILCLYSFSRSYSPSREPWNVRITGEGEGTEATERMV